MHKKLPDCKNAKKSCQIIKMQKSCQIIKMQKKLPDYKNVKKSCQKWKCKNKQNQAGWAPLYMPSPMQHVCSRFYIDSVHVCTNLVVFMGAITLCLGTPWLSSDLRNLVWKDGAANYSSHFLKVVLMNVMHMPILLCFETCAWWKTVSTFSTRMSQR